MSDLGYNKEIDLKPSQVDVKAEQPEKFPFDAWEFDDPDTTTSPALNLKRTWQFSAAQKILSKSAAYTLTDKDGSCTVLVTTGATNKTITLPTLADNIGVEFTIVKVDSGAGHVVIDGEGSEVIYNYFTSFTTIELWQQFEFIRIRGDGTQWIKVNSPYLHFITEASRSAGAYNLSVNPTTTWALADLSGSVPPGTLALYGLIYISNTDAASTLLLRSAEDPTTDVNATISRYNNLGVGSILASAGFIRAKNGQFDYAEQAATTEITVFGFELWAYLL